MAGSKKSNPDPPDGPLSVAGCNDSGTASERRVRASGAITFERTPYLAASSETIRDNARFFGSEDLVPRLAVTDTDLDVAIKKDEKRAALAAASR